jgi:DNA-binding MarR family transcriptional regulator
MSNSKAQKRAVSVDDERAAVRVRNKKEAAKNALPTAGRARAPVRRLHLDRAELDSTLGFRLREAWASMERYFLDTFRDEGISPPLYALLILVEANPDCLASEICREIGISAANIVPYVDYLVGQGLIVREAGVHDRRNKHLAITTAGCEYLKELRKLHKAVDEHFARRIGKDNMRKLVELLRAMGNEIHASRLDALEVSERKLRT